jgi:hypothetical protein
MKQRRRGNKAKAEAEGGGSTELAAMRMTVKQREDADGRGADGGGNAHREGNEEAEADHGSQDAGLDERQGSADKRQSEAGCHERDKGGRHGPACPATDLPGPKTDGDHRQHMVGAGEGMRRTCHEGAVPGGIEMGEGRGGGGGEDGGSGGKALQHSGPLGMFERSSADYPLMVFGFKTCRYVV